MALISANWPQFRIMQEQTPAKKIKRTHFSSWSSGVMGSSSKASPGATGPASPPKKDGPSPEPARIMSDLVAQAAQGGPPSVSQGLSAHPNIVAMQAAWEKDQLGDGSRAAGGLPSVDAGAEKGPAVGPAAQTAASLVGREPAGVASASAPPSTATTPMISSQKKRPGPETPSSEPPNKKHQVSRRALPSGPLSTAKGHNSVRAEARRFTDAAVAKRMASLTVHTNPKPEWQQKASTPEQVMAMIKQGPLKGTVTPAYLKTEVSASQSTSSTNSTKPKTATAPASQSVALAKSQTTPTPTSQFTAQAKPKTAVPPQKVEPPASQPASSTLPKPGPPTSTGHFTAVTTSTASGKSAPKVGDRLAAIPIAEGDRLYSLYPEPQGGAVSARGALIPAKYKLHDNPQLPFICPVRDCRRLFPSLKGLGGHFAAGHCTLTFNDNGDGTLSKVGSYVNHGLGGTPGIVISRNPLPPDAPPPIDPGLSFFSARINTPTPKLTSPENPKPSLRPSTVSAVPLPKIPPSPRSGVKDYLHGFLLPKQKIYKREDVRYMITLPKKRELPQAWIDCHRDTELDSTHYACALAYLTGDEVLGSDKCESHTRYHSRPTSRLSKHCIRVPANMHMSSKRLFSSFLTCVGCKYWSHLQRQTNQCDWSPHPQVPRGASALSSSSTETNADKPNMTGVGKPEPDSELDSDEDPVQDLRQTRRRHVASASASASATSVTMVESKTVETAGQLSGPALEMEEWEVAPGRMTDGSSSQNIAFSNSYLTSGQPVSVSEDVSFNVLVIKPGSSNHWTIEDDRLRTVSVAAGKVNVTMSEKSFQLGPNGMFVVRPGQTCKVENRLYVDSVVHCTTIANFELQ
ncbi:hypothetical protein BKA56DRAFT_578176 [Ilyonectria sp. MPI-CAGE-AT-0026]|nr:hypothetical protein BKA56DRAFT_578176 [Ilyonectria sp. MPI-CAGE-AT-0026]